MINYSDVYASTYDDDSEIIDITHALNLKKFVLPLLTASLISWVISNNVLYDRPSTRLLPGLEMQLVISYKGHDHCCRTIWHYFFPAL
jgi:hypothetical protein